MSIRDMVEHCLTNPVLSRTHDWGTGAVYAQQKSEYDSMRHYGRTLYDDLRTQFNLSHGQAFDIARSFRMEYTR